MSFSYQVKHFITHFPYNIKYGFINLFIWFKVIWCDRNWDQYYIYVIFRHKLKLMEQNIRKNGNHVDSEKDADKIKKCILLLDRLIKDEYEEKCFKKVDKKWGELTMNLNDDRKIRIHRSKVVTEQDSIQERKDSAECWKNADMLRKQDKELLFKLMYKHIDSWWD